MRRREASPGVPDSDLTVKVSTDDAVLRTDEVAAVRHHFDDLHTCTKSPPHSVISPSGRSLIGGSHRGDSQAALWRSHHLMVLSALPVTT